MLAPFSQIMMPRFRQLPLMMAADDYAAMPDAIAFTPAGRHYAAIFMLMPIRHFRHAIHRCRVAPSASFFHAAMPLRFYAAAFTLTSRHYCPPFSLFSCPPPLFSMPTLSRRFIFSFIFVDTLTPLSLSPPAFFADYAAHAPCERRGARKHER
jgi:hypothetical protein